MISDYQKLEYIYFQLQEAMDSLKKWRGYEDPDLMTAIGYVEELCEPYLFKGEMSPENIHTREQLSKFLGYECSELQWDAYGQLTDNWDDYFLDRIGPNQFRYLMSELTKHFDHSDYYDRIDNVLSYVLTQIEIPEPVQ